MKMTKSLIICGPQGSGKTTLARHIAGISGKFVTTTMAELTHGSPFMMGRLLQDAPDTVIVEEFQGTPSELSEAKMLTACARIDVHLPLTESKSAPLPNFIFCSGSIDPIKLDAADRRFIVVDLNNEPL